MLSQTEENYIKAIYQLSSEGTPEVATNTIADHLNTSAASVTDMIKKLSAKKLLDYKRYKGVRITSKGRSEALKLIRKHRLWETFLVRKLNFSWDQVHVVAEQLEHIDSSLLISRLDEYLDYPKVDPHGDPIPDKNGNIKEVLRKKLSDLQPGTCGTIVGVNDSSSSFLKYLDKIGATIGSDIEIIDRIEFDGSLEIEINAGSKVFVSKEVSENIMLV